MCLIIVEFLLILSNDQLYLYDIKFNLIFIIHYSYFNNQLYKNLLVSPGSVCDTLTYRVTRSAPRRVLLNCVISGAASKIKTLNQHILYYKEYNIKHNNFQFSTRIKLISKI